MPKPQIPHQREVSIAPGVSARTIVEAATSDEVVAVLTEAHARDETVVPFGGTHSVVTGHEVEPFDIGLDIRSLTGILSHEPADLVLSVRAGTTLAEIQGTLGESGQGLPLDVPFPETATIGGLVATGFAGPRRLRSGSLRDLLIGCEFVRGDGLLAKGGGMVVKNVSGFEIPRFLHGSWGALAVVTSVNLKVFPQARADGTTLATMPDAASALELAQSIIANGAIPVDACTVTIGASSVEVAVRMLGRQRSVAERLEAVGRLVEGARILTGDESGRFWQDQVEQFAEKDGAIVVTAATRARLVTTLTEAVKSELQGCPDIRMLVSPGLGSVRASWPANPESADLLRSVAKSLEDVGASYVIECAPPGLRSVVSPWGVTPNGIDVMRAIKQEFDPRAILNRGRLFV